MASEKGVSKRGKPSKHKRYSFKIKLRSVKLFLEEGYPADLIAQEMGVGGSSIHSWVRAYREKGEAGLKLNYFNFRKEAKAFKESKAKAVEIKACNPTFGVRHISDLIKRLFFLPSNPETVRQTLQEHGLASPVQQRKPTKNINRPRFFERTTPNQLWQTDIFTFKLLGNYAYLIGYIDDYSRYIVGLELFRSQTAENVIEVYRRAISEYKIPKEMLTDNGRQYSSWRGNTRFQREIKKDKIHHIRSAPHHPMTLGKVERFWKTIHEEFLVRARFETFEEARERIRDWVKYYNHKRPHQGIGGLCPADRYYEIAHEVKKTIEKGIAENIKELALRGKPKKPIYMVGQLNGQSVVLQEEQGKLKLSLDGNDMNRQEIIYNLKEGDHAHENNQTEQNDKRGNQGQDERGTESFSERSVQRLGEGSGCVKLMDRKAETHHDMPGDEHPLHESESMAGSGLGRDASGAGASKQLGERDCLESSDTEFNREAREERPEGSSKIIEVRESVEGFSKNKNRQSEPGGHTTQVILEQVKEIDEGEGSASAETRIDYSVSTARRDHGQGGRGSVGNKPQDLLQMGEKVAGSDDPGLGGSSRGPSDGTGGFGEGRTQEGDQILKRETSSLRTDDRGEEYSKSLRRETPDEGGKKGS